jgi:hypothetical protein
MKEEGIYFNMPEEEYHSLPYLSRSMMEDILVDVEEAWYNSWFNPNKPRQQPTDAMELGTAIHSAVLEPEVFEELYAKIPSYDDYEDKVILHTNEQISDFLASVGEKKSGKKEELIQRVLPYVDPNTTIIWQLVLNDFYDSINHGGKRSLSREWFELIEEIQKSIERRPLIQEVFSDGYPEVTIIWKDEWTGVMCKCRLDYLKTNAIGELKSFCLRQKKNMYKACCDDIVYRKYNLQFAVYSKAVETIIKKIKMNTAKVFGEVDEEWLKEFLGQPKKQFRIVFVRTAQPYQAISIELARNEGNSDNVYYSEPLYWFRKSAEKFKSMVETFGEKRWIERNYIRELNDVEVKGTQYQFNAM